MSPSEEIRKRISSLIDEDGVADVQLLGAELPGVDDDRVGDFPLAALARPRGTT